MMFNVCEDGDIIPFYNIYNKTTLIGGVLPHSQNMIISKNFGGARLRKILKNLFKYNCSHESTNYGNLYKKNICFFPNKTIERI